MSQDFSEENEQTLQEASEAQQPGAPKYTCKYCGATFPTLYLLGGHSKTCQKRREALVSEKTEPLYKTELEPNIILEEILSKHPDITERIKEEIMDWARLKGFLQPMEVQAIIESFRGISKTTAQIIAAKYAFALSKAQQEGKLTFYPAFPSPIPQPPTFIPQPPVYTPVTPPTQAQPQMQVQTAPSPISPQIQVPPPSQPTWTHQPFPSQQPYQPYQPYDIRSIIREELRYITESSKPKESEAYVEIERVVRLPDGKIVIGPDDKPIFEKIKVPVSQAHLFTGREPSEVEILRQELKTLRDELKSKEIEALREEIRELRERATEGQPAPSIDEVVDKAVKRAIEEKERERKEDERFARLEKAIREAVTAKAVEGYKEDSYRILGQGLSEIASVVKERKPLEVVVREGGQLLLGTPPPKEVESGAEPESILERLKKRGWVAEQ